LQHSIVTIVFTTTAGSSDKNCIHADLIPINLDRYGKLLFSFLALRRVLYIYGEQVKVFWGVG
jgi:hypothetical protein